MILMPILLMNLLIGLAVGDIESVRRNAQLKRLAMQVNYTKRKQETKLLDYNSILYIRKRTGEVFFCF